MKTLKKNLQTGQIDVVKTGYDETLVTPGEIVLLAGAFTNLEEMAGYFGLSRRQLYNRFRRQPELQNAYREGKSKGKVLLRQAQFNTAIKGNPQLLVWMGKQHLGQSDRVTVTLDEEGLITDRMTQRFDDEMLQILEDVKKLDGQKEISND